jgi:hypothetical protein
MDALYSEDRDSLKAERDLKALAFQASFGPA